MTRLEDIGTAAAGIAHDINNHLTVILNALDFDEIESAKAATIRCCTMTRTLLEYSRGEVLNRKLAPLGALVNVHCMSRNYPPLIEFDLITPEGPDVSVDPHAFYRVLENLIGNACDAMANRGKITITTTPYTITVEDNGPGIPPEHIKRIFEPFFSTKGSAGTGLGLGIVRDIMHQHGGSVTVYSEVGRGTRFTLKFRNELCQ